jgi:heme exporter protein C
MTPMHRYANPGRFLALSSAMLPWICAFTGLLFMVGLPLALVFSPADYQQGDAVRIMYVHVPAAWVAMSAYAVMAAASLVALVWRHALADVAASAVAAIGATFTAIALTTGMLWGKPMWGAYWVWDARLTSVLVLFFLYLGAIAIRQAYDDRIRGARAAQILSILGAVNLPIIKFSVDWWNTLHQGESIFRKGGPTISSSMLLPLGIMTLAYTLLFFMLLILRMRTMIFEQQGRAAIARRASTAELHEASARA